MESANLGADVFFVLMGAVMVLAMHAGFAFLEVGTVRRKNQVNALIKIFSDFCVSTIVYFFVGYLIAYGIDFLSDARVLTGKAPGSPFASGPDRARSGWSAKATCWPSSAAWRAPN